MEINWKMFQENQIAFFPFRFLRFIAGFEAQSQDNTRNLDPEFKQKLL